MALEGKAILITGGARRVGRSLVLAAAQAGADIFLHYHQSEREAEALRDELFTLGHRAMLLKADLNDPQQSADLVGRAGRAANLFALVNNAAIFEPVNWETTDLAAWNRHMQINLTAPFQLSQAFARGLDQKSSGRIVNVLDARELRPGADYLPYSVSKTGLAGLTRALAVALAPRITVNGLALGAVLAPENATPEVLLDQIPARRWASLDEVGQALIFFLDGPAYITGEILHVDGGRQLV